MSLPAVDSYLVKNARYVMVILGLTLCFTVHNYLQELLMGQPGFRFGAILAFLDVVGVTFFSGIERVVKNEKTRVAPWSSYFLLCCFLCMSSSAANAALNYINYPTRVIFRSCKLVPTIIIAIVLNNKSFYLSELILGIAMSMGMAMFAFADFNVSDSTSPYGLFLVTVSVFADSMLPNLQVQVLATGASRAEVTFFTNCLCFIMMTGSFSLSGDLQGALTYAASDVWGFSLMLLYTGIAYMAVTCHMILVEELGPVAAVIVGNARKALTIILSFVLFPKPFSVLYMTGVVLVFGSVILNVVLKEKRKNSQKHRKIPTKDAFASKDIKKENEYP